MGSSSRTMSSRTSSRTTTTTSSRTQPSTTTTTTTRSQPTTSSFTTKRVDSMLGGYGAKEDEVSALLSKSPEVEEFESKLNTSLVSATVGLRKSTTHDSTTNSRL